MTSNEARTLLYRCYQAAETYTTGAGRPYLLEWLQKLSDALRNPAALATDDELFDAVVTRDGDLLLDLGRQLNTDTLEQLLAERRAEEAKREAM